MEFYDIDEIKKRGDCVEYIEKVLGLSSRNDRYQAKWRGGDGYNVAVQKEKWYDHRAKSGGSIIDLCAVARHGGNIALATEELGKWLGLSPSIGLRVTKSRRVVAEYIYNNKDGNPIHKTLRYEPKEFAQLRFDDGRWVGGLDGIETVPYRLNEWASSDEIVICEGEKDVDNISPGIQATTFPMGADKWKDEWGQWFDGKKVVILRDNDDAGISHAKRIAWELRERCKSIKVVCPCIAKPKGDVSDFLADGGTIEEIKSLIATTDELSEISKPSSADIDKDLARAKELNKYPLTNYKWVESRDENGKIKRKIAPRKIMEIVDDVHQRLLQFPKLIGDVLFDRDRDTGKIREIRNGTALQSWVSEKTGHQPAFKSRGLDGAVKWETLYESLYSNADTYEGISYAPSYPSRKEIYHTHPTLPDPSTGHKYFNQMMDFFSPATAADAIMLRALFASPLYYRFGEDRPLWVIDSKHGRGSGKTTIAKKLSLLYDFTGEHDSGGDIMTIDPELIGKESGQQQLYKRILSPSGRSKRIILLDNVTGFFKSSSIASMITFDKISGMAPYGRGESTRRQDMTWILTSNSATLDSDLIMRSIFINVGEPKRSKTWGQDVNHFINSHRLQIFADIIDIIKAGSQFEFKQRSRFGRWEHDVLAPMCMTLNNYSLMWRVNEERQIKSDGESEEADTIQDYFASRLRENNCDPANDIFWITSPVLRRWCSECVPEFGGRTGRNTSHKLKNAINAGQIKMLSADIEKFPFSGPNRARGMMWNYEKYKSDMQRLAPKNEKPYVRSVTMDNQGKISVEFNKQEEDNFC